MKIKISIDNKRYYNKPVDEEIAKICDGLANNIIEMNINDIAFYVGENGYAWCPAIFSEGKKTTANYKHQQIFVLDFDGSITWDELKKRADKYLIPIAFAYETFSSVNQNKFRVAFCCDAVIDNIKVSEMIQKTLMMLFKECDPSCCDVVKMYFGGQRIIYTNEKSNSFLNLRILMMSLTKYYYDTYGSTHYLRELKKFTDNVGVICKGNMPYVTEIEEDCVLLDGNWEARPIIYKRRSAPGLPKSYYVIYILNIKDGRTQKEKNYVSFSTGKRDLIRRFNFDKLNKCCQLFNEFANGDRWLHNEELFGIATNLCQIKGGKKLFTDIIYSQCNSEYSSYNKKDWNFYLNYIEKMDYKPESCIKFCKYCNTCSHSKSIFATAKTPKGRIIEINSERNSFVSIKEAENDLQRVFRHVQEKEDESVHVIVSQTGLGKSTCYINAITTSENHDKPYMIAVPTNKLKREIYEKLQARGVNVMMTPSTNDLNVDDDIRREIDKLYQMGAAAQVGKYINKVISERHDPELEEYARQIRTLKSFKGHIVTTHKRFIHYGSEELKKYNIIIDEDIMKTLMETNSISNYDLKRLKELCYSIPEIQRKVSYVMDGIEDYEYFLCPTLSSKTIFSFEKFITEACIEFNSNVVDFLRSSVIQAKEESYSDYALQSIQYLVKRQLPNQKIIILSATANEYIYKKFLGKRDVQFYYCKEVKYKGKLIQYPEKSFSRSCISNNPDIFEKVYEMAGTEIPVITFRKFKNALEADIDIHYGKTEGHNCLEGMDIAVVGTPHMDESVYRMYALALGLDIEGDLGLKEIEYNNFRFWFTTYDNLDLRLIQLWLIGSELEQSIGRARLLRNHCTVHLFSSFPVKQAVFYEGKLFKQNGRHSVFDNIGDSANTEKYLIAINM